MVTDLGARVVLTGSQARRGERGDVVPNQRFNVLTLAPR